MSALDRLRWRHDLDSLIDRSKAEPDEALYLIRLFVELTETGRGVPASLKAHVASCLRNGLEDHPKHDFAKALNVARGRGQRLGSSVALSDDERQEAEDLACEWLTSGSRPKEVAARLHEIFGERRVDGRPHTLSLSPFNTIVATANKILKSPI